MKKSLSGVVVLLNGQAPNVEPFISFRAELEKRVQRGEITVVWLDGGPTDKPLLYSGESVVRLPIEQRLFPGLSFDFQDTQGLHSNQLVTPIEEGLQRAKLEHLRLLINQGQIEVISISFPFRHNPPELSQTCALRAYDRLHWDKITKILLSPKGILLPVGQSPSSVEEFFSLADQSSSHYFWHPVPLSDALESEVLSEELFKLGIVGIHHRAGEVFNLDAKFPSRKKERVLEALRTGEQDETYVDRFAQEGRARILEFLVGKEIQRQQDLEYRMTKNNSEDFLGMLLSIDEAVRLHSAKDRVVYDFDSIPIGDLSDAMKAAVQQAREDVEALQAEIQLLEGDRDQVIAELFQAQSRLSELLTREKELKALERSLTDRLSERIKQDLRLVDQLTKCAQKLELHSDANGRSAERKSAIATAKALLDENADFFESLSYRVAHRDVDSIRLEDAVVFALAHRVTALSGSRSAYLSAIRELDSVYVLSELVKSANPEQIAWYDNLDKLTPGVSKQITSHMIKAAFDAVGDIGTTMEETRTVLEHMQFTPTRAVLDPVNDIEFEVERASVIDVTPSLPGLVVNRPVLETTGVAQVLAREV